MDKAASSSAVSVTLLIVSLGMASWMEVVGGLVVVSVMLMLMLGNRGLVAMVAVK